MNFKNTEQKKSYNLCNIENYNSSINCNLSDILNKYTLIIFDYMKLISEQINIKHQKYYHFIFMRGLDTITNVFKMLLFLTKNIDLTYFHSQKAFYFYVEFIEQIFLCIKKQYLKLIMNIEKILIQFKPMNKLCFLY